LLLNLWNWSGCGGWVSVAGQGGVVASLMVVKVGRLGLWCWLACSRWVSGTGQHREVGSLVLISMEPCLFTPVC
jgi:hypothetical protein